MHDEDDEDLVNGQLIDGQADATDLPSSLPAAWQIPMVNAPPYQVPPGSTPPPVQSDSDIVKRAIANISSDGKGYGKEELLQAQRLANQSRFNAGVGETASNLAYAIAGVKNPNPNAFASIKEQANAPLDDFKAGRALSQEDKKTDLDTQKIVMANMIAKAKQAQSQAGQNLKERELTETQDHHQTMEDILGDKADAAALATKGKISAQDQGALDKAYKETMGRDAVKKAYGAVNSSDALLDLIESAKTNPASANALPIYMARLSTGDQRINQTEIQALGMGAKDFQDRISQIVSNAKTGTLTPENAAYAKAFVELAKKSAQRNYEKTVGESANFVHKNRGLSLELVRDRFGLPPLVSDNSENSKQPVQASTAAGAQDPKISAYAQQHGLDYSKAEAILRGRGYGR